MHHNRAIFWQAQQHLRRNFSYDVDFLVLKCQQTHLIIGNEVIGDVLNLRLLAPVIIIALHADGLLWLIVVQQVRACSDWIFCAVTMNGEQGGSAVGHVFDDEGGVDLGLEGESVRSGLVKALLIDL